MPQTAPSLRRRGRVLAAGTALILIATLAVVVRSPAIIHAPSKDRDFAIVHFPLPSYSIPVQTIAVKPHQGGSLIPNAFSGVATVFALIVLFAIVFGLGWLALSWWDRRPRRAGGPSRIAAPVPELLAGLQEAERRLALGAPRNAVIACWVAVEEAAARSGVPPLASDTSAEFTLRLLDSLEVDSEALQQLSLLYRRARFSSHDVDETDRERAGQYLRRIRADLDEQVLVP